MALKGVADVCLALAYGEYSRGSLGQVARCLSEGIQILETVLTDKNDQNSGQNSDLERSNNNGNESERIQDFIGLWKILGDLCSFARHVGPGDVARFMTNSTEDSSEYTSIYSSEHSPDNFVKRSLFEELALNGFGQGDIMPSFSPLLNILKKGEMAYRKILELFQLKSELKMKTETETDLITENSDIPSYVYCDIGCSLYYQGVVILQTLGQGSGILTAENNEAESESGRLFMAAREYFTKGN